MSENAKIVWLLRSLLFLENADIQNYFGSIELPEIEGILRWSKLLEQKICFYKQDALTGQLVKIP
jgi:hypothetical protein